MSVAAVSNAEPPRGYPGQGKSQGNGPPTEYGASVSHGDGAFTPYGTVVAGVPRSIGISFPASTLENQPAAPSDGKWDVLDEDGKVVWHCCGHERSMEVTGNLLDPTLFEHIVVNWNPHGHVPPGVFDTPHYDFHFYIIDEATRKSIRAPMAEEMCEPSAGADPVPVTCDDYARLTAPVPEDQYPQDYIRPGAVEPGMGDHMLDPYGSGLNGNPFDHTFIFGAQDGALSFFEPMITLAYLRSKPNACFPIRVPAALPEAAWAPTQYCIRYRPGRDEYTVSLESFVYLPKSGG
ncbi:MAG: hypothetical protein JXB36_05065 [Gammaproteobacteria bacterium]|nr:hypothetical protein [Gammaproteobacteria bacterium]